jgi:AcrR family transcriptional regulator
MAVRRAGGTAGQSTVSAAIARTGAARARVKANGAASTAREPQQHRSRERVTRILDASREHIRESGVTATNMSAIAKRARIPIGSLYQYFPSKGALVRRLFKDRLDDFYVLALKAAREVDSPRRARSEIRKLVLEIYRANREDPLMQDVWAGVQADREIRHIHQDDNAFYRQIFIEIAGRGRSTLRGMALRNRVTVIIEMLDSVIRLAITLDAQQGMAIIEEALGVAIREIGLPR